MCDAVATVGVDKVQHQDINEKSCIDKLGVSARNCPARLCDHLLVYPLEGLLFLIVSQESIYIAPIIVKRRFLSFSFCVLERKPAVEATISPIKMSQRRNFP